MWAKQSTAATLIVGPVLDSTGAEYTSAVISDLSISKNGGTLTALAAAATLTHIANGQYTLVMTTGNLDTLGRAQITCNKSTYQMPPIGLVVVPAMVFDSLVLGTDVLQSDVTQFGGTAGTFASGVPTAALDSAARVKLDAVQPDYAPLLASGYTAPANSDITAIKAKTDNLPSDPADQSLIIVATDAVMARLGAPAGLSMSADLAAVKLETGTTLPAQIAALNNLSSAQVVSALGSGTWATALPWNAAWDSEVQSEVQDAIEVNNLDHLLKIAVDTNFATTVHLDSVIGNIADNGTTATFVRTTDSLEAIRDNQSSSSGASLEDIIAGVQSVSGGIIAAQDSSAFYITSGDTWTQDVDALGNIVGKTLVFTIKRNARDADTAALVLINSTDGLTRLAGAAASNSAWGSLTVLNSTLGNIRLTLKSDATLLLKSGTYSDGIKSLEVGDDMTLRQRGKTIISVGVINDIS